MGRQVSLCAFSAGCCPGTGSGRCPRSASCYPTETLLQVLAPPQPAGLAEQQGQTGCLLTELRAAESKHQK